MTGADAAQLNAGRASYSDVLHDDELEFQRRYGPWAAFTPQQARPVFDATGLEWWIAGGWSIEAFTGVSRPHEDIDVSLWRRDVPELVRAFAGTYDVWAAGGGLTPLFGDRLVLPDTSDQVWIREHALAPWVADCVVNPDRDGRWVNRREPTWDAPLGEITFTRDGIRYLNPEIALAFKAKGDRPKDRADLEAALPLLDAEQRTWLREFLGRVHPDHAWLQRLHEGSSR
ncbi:MAG: hypothetical protein WAK18_18645 [Nocardioidaceae bacterium]